jgi:hypothetical protein
MVLAPCEMSDTVDRLVREGIVGKGVQALEDGRRRPILTSVRIKERKVPTPASRH